MQIGKNDCGELKSDTCVLSKAKRKPVPKDIVDRANNALDIFLVDIFGPLTIIDTQFHLLTVFPDLGTPQKLVSDGAKEFFSSQFSRFCRENNVRLENSATYTPEENVKVERKWGTTTSMTRCLLDKAGLGKEYWTYAMNYAFYIKNYCFHSAIGKTPYEKMYGSKPNVFFV